MQPIADLNQMGLGDFAAALKPLFEAAAPLARALYGERPFASYPELIERAEAVAAKLPLAEQIEIVNAHPRIGESAEAVRQTSVISYAEQGYSAEAALPPDELNRVYLALAGLNQQYEARFGFRFMVFVNGRPKSELLDVVQTRLHNSPETELQAALQAMFLIARDRYARSE